MGTKPTKSKDTHNFFKGKTELTKSKGTIKSGVLTKTYVSDEKTGDEKTVDEQSNCSVDEKTGNEKTGAGKTGAGKLNCSVDQKTLILNRSLEKALMKQTSVDVIDILLNHGADPLSLCSKWKYSAYEFTNTISTPTLLEIALLVGEINVLEKICASLRDSDRLFEYYDLYNFLLMIMSYIDDDVNECDTKIDKLIFMTRTHKFLKTCLYILKKDLKLINNHIKSYKLLKKACKYGDLEIVKIFVESGYNIDVGNGSFLRKAAENDQRLIIDYLISNTNIMNTPGIPFKEIMISAIKHENTSLLELCINSLDKN